MNSSKKYQYVKLYIVQLMQMLIQYHFLYEKKIKIKMPLLLKIVHTLMTLTFNLIDDQYIN